MRAVWLSNNAARPVRLFILHLTIGCCCPIPAPAAPSPPHAAYGCSAAGTPAQARTWKIYTAAFAVLCLGLGFAAGFFTAKHMGTDYLSACYRSRADDDAAVDGALQPLPHTRGMPVTGYALRELPPPWSQEGRSKEQQDDSGEERDWQTTDMRRGPGPHPNGSCLSGTIVSQTAHSAAQLLACTAQNYQHRSTGTGRLRRQNSSTEVHYASRRIPALLAPAFALCPVAPAPSFLPLPPAHRADLFTYFSDTETITEGLTVAFLGHLQTSLGASGVNSSANIDLQEVIQEFKSVARDVLSYLRYHNSQALLLLLRQYSQTRSFTMADVDPDVLQQEVQRLLDLRELGNWYARVSRRDTDGHVTRPTIGIQATEASGVTHSKSIPVWTNTCVRSNNRRSVATCRTHTSATCRTTVTRQDIALLVVWSCLRTRVIA